MAKRNIPWLDAYAEQLKSSQNKKTASVKEASTKKEVTASKIEAAKKIILRKDQLEKAVNGETVKYRNYIWKIVDASYKDTKGLGVVCEKVAAVSTKKVTDPAEYARTDPGDVYDYEVRDSYEVPELLDTAAKTEVAIAQENAIDRTTPAGRATNPYVAVAEEAAQQADEETVEEAIQEEQAAEKVVEETTPVEETEVAEPVEEEATEPVEKQNEESVAEESQEDEIAEHDMKASFAKELITAATKAFESEEEEKAPQKRDNPIIASIVGSKKKANKNRIIASILKKA